MKSFDASQRWDMISEADLHDRTRLWYDLRGGGNPTCLISDSLGR